MNGCEGVEGVGMVGLMLRGRLCRGSGGGMMLGIEGIGIGWDDIVRVGSF